VLAVDKKTGRPAAVHRFGAAVGCRYPLDRPGLDRLGQTPIIAGVSSRPTASTVPRPVRTAPPEARDAADPDITTDHRPPCPCCGGRMIIVEVFGRGGAPRGPPPDTKTRIFIR
jgi:hypothetical protein